MAAPTLIPLMGASAPRTQDSGAWAHGTRRVSLPRAASGQAEKVQDGFSVKTGAGRRPRQSSEKVSPTQTHFPDEPI